MSEQYAEIIRRQVEAVNRGDVEAVLSDMDAGIEFIPQRAAVQGVYHGHDGVRDFFADTFENFDLFEASTDEVRELGDRVVSIGTLRIRGKGSGIEVSGRRRLSSPSVMARSRASRTSSRSQRHSKPSASGSLGLKRTPPDCSFRCCRISRKGKWRIEATCGQKRDTARAMSQERR